VIDFVVLRTCYITAGLVAPTAIDTSYPNKMMQSSYYVRPESSHERRFKHFTIQSNSLPNSLIAANMIQDPFVDQMDSPYQHPVSPNTFIHPQNDVYGHSPQSLSLFNTQYRTNQAEQVLNMVMSSQGYDQAPQWQQQPCQSFDTNFMLPQQAFPDTHHDLNSGLMIDCGSYSGIQFGHSFIETPQDYVDEDDGDSDASIVASATMDYSLSNDNRSRSVSPSSSPMMPSTPGKRGRKAADSSPPKTPRKTKRSKTPSTGRSSYCSTGSLDFVNYTPNDSRKILTGVAPSGSSKTKARREREASEKRRRLSEAAEKAIMQVGGDVEALRREGILE
jgi:hypothetical protein